VASVSAGIFNALPYRASVNRSGPAVMRLLGADTYPGSEIMGCSKGTRVASAPQPSLCCAVAAGLIHRTDDPADRRYVVLRLTTEGHQLVQSVIDQRSAAIATVLAKMPPRLRDDLLSRSARLRRRHRRGP
jgi:hypothetical protein